MRSASWIESRPVQAALKTYTLSLSLSLGPSLVPFVTALITSRTSNKTGLQAFKRLLKRELSLDGFAFAMTVSVGGGAAIRELWRLLDAVFEPISQRNQPNSNTRIVALNLSSTHKTFVSNFLSSMAGILLVKSGRESSYRLRHGISSPNSLTPATQPLQSARTLNTLDLTLIFVVRALDSVFQNVVRKVVEGHLSDTKSVNGSTSERTGRDYVISKVVSSIDALVFWACSARIMWCFFYEPERLPRSYIKWIATLANLDNRIIQALRAIREGRWSYHFGPETHSHILTEFSRELGYKPSWGDPAMLPAYGGATADAAWKSLGVNNRSGVGGLPCELVHGSVGRILGLQGNCTANWSIRGLMAFLEAIAIYLPVHFLPVLLTRPHTLLKLHQTFRTLLGALRSASFLSAFVTLYWFAVCTTRSLVLARLLPTISHDFWDGPFGCIFAGSLACGSSIWIENGRRRGEMALYVLPRAIRALLPDTWIQRSNIKAGHIESLAFGLSFATLITAATHQPEALRGLSRWVLSFIINRNNPGLFQLKRRNSNSTDLSASN